MIKNVSLKYLFLLGIICNSYLFQAQIVVTPNITANALINRLAGSGIIFSNATLTCPNNASGKFDNGLASSILIDSGIVLTTGRALTTGSAFGVNGAGAGFASINNGINGGDANLFAAAGSPSGNIHDLCKLEFDFIPTGDTIQFRYRFGSEEYPIYNCSDFNDIFAFFISGPGYATPTNVALVPGTNIPVTINSINNGTVSGSGGGVLSNCTSLGLGSPFVSLYVNNATSTTITYGGLTALLTAKAPVTPCSIYHMKFAIADVTDHIWDSGVFLEAGSFSSDVATVISVSSSNNIPTGTPFAMEGCNSAIITIARPLAKPYAQTVTYTLSGTATNGIDITALSGSTTIPANATTTTITVNALQDGLIEGIETLIFAINGSLCGSGVTETLTMNINEYPHFIKPISDTICNAQSISLSVIPLPANPDLTFNWAPTLSLNVTTGINVIATPTATTTYIITTSYPGCPSVDSSFTISVDPIPTLSLSHTNVTCNGLSNGSITATGSASLPMIITLMPSGATSNVLPFTFSNLAAGVYTVTVTSAAGCTKTSTTSITIPNVVSWTNTQSINPLCSGIADGSIQVSANGGSGTLNYTLLPTTITNTSGNFPALNAGSYTVNATDANGCSISTILNLTVSNPIIWNNTNFTNVTPCFGNANATITAAASGGSGILTYTLNPSLISNTTGIYTNLNPASYTVQVSDANGCTNSTTINITQPSAVQIASFSSINILCNGNNTGAITMNVTGGTGLKQYTLLPTGTSSTSGSYANLVAGIYTITAADANGCTISSGVNLTQPNAIVYSIFNVNNVACNGGSTGSIMAQCSGGNGIFNYTLLPTGTTNTSGIFNALAAGNYTLQAVDANGCTKSSTAVIIQQALLLFTNAVITQVDCYGNNSGIINITAAGGSGVITYNLMPIVMTNTTGIFNSLLSGIYTVTASDILGCTNSTFINITQPSLLQFATVTKANPACVNVNNGSIIFSATGGSPTYLYSLNGGAFTNNNSFTNLAIGNYTLHIKDSKGCIKDSVITLIPTNNLIFTSIAIQNIECKFDNTGTISLNTIGGIAPYLYQVNGASAGSIGNFLNLTAGNYSIFVTDSVGCLQDTILNISEPAQALSFGNISINNILCYGNQTGQINVSAFGGTTPYQFAINTAPLQSTSYFPNLFAGFYTITLQDFYGCTKDTILQIKQPLQPLVITLKKLKEITCIGLEDGELHMSVTGGTKPYLFTINSIANGSDSSFINLKTGTYLIEVTDSNGCKAMIAFAIAVPTKQPYIILENLIQNICQGEQNGSIDWMGINGFPPYKYTVNTNFIDTVNALYNLVSGNYFIELVDDKGCKTDTIVTIASSTTLEVIMTTTSASCDGKGDDGKAEIEVSGGALPYTYEWVGFLNNTNALQHIKYGNYIVIVTDAESCKDTSRYTIEYTPCCNVYMPNAFSPNNDNRNDMYKMLLYGIVDLKSFEIFDRWGKKIFYSNKLNGEWDGKLQGVDYEIGTYYYLVKYYCQLSKELVIKKGDFILLR